MHECVHGFILYEIWELKMMCDMVIYVGDNKFFDHIKLIKEFDFIDIDILVNVIFECCDN